MQNGEMTTNSIAAYSGDRSDAFGHSQPNLAALTPHDSILITNNSQFGDQGWPGQGVEENPYLIESLLIHVTHSDVAINISKTDVYFEVRHCVFTSNSTETTDIKLQNVSHCKIWNTTFLDSRYGIRTESCEQIVVHQNLFLNQSGESIRFQRTNSSFISSNNCTECKYGIVASYSISNTFENNYFSHHPSGKNNGISIHYCNSSIVRDNELQGFYNPLYIAHCNDIQIAGNNCTSSTLGLDGYDISNCDIIENTFNGNRTSAEGILLDYAISNTISGNNCTLNEFGIYLCEECSHNLISSNTCNNNTYGIYLEKAFRNDNNEISLNTCEFNEIGVYLDQSARNIVQDNLLRFNNDTGISAWYVNDTAITRNHIVGGLIDSQIGIYTMGLNNDLTFNTIKTCHLGLFLDDSLASCSIHGNIVRNTTYCVLAFIASDTPVTWNIFQYYEFAFIESGGYTVEYNYWSEYDGVDANTDGYGDTPYPVGNIEDPYPLVYLPILPVWDIEPSDQNVEFGNDFEYTLNVLSTPGIAPITSWEINNTGLFSITAGVISSTTDLALGDIPLEVRAINIYDHYLVGTFTLTVQDTTDPILSTPADIAYQEGATGNWINWSATDLLPSSYQITVNGSLLQAGVWNESDEVIRVSVDGLATGEYTYELTVFDGGGNSASDIVVVTVEALPPSDDGTLLIALAVAGVGVVVLVIVVYLGKKSPKEP